VVSTTGTLAATSYSISGTDSDSAMGDAGTWSYTLTVTNTILEGSSTSATVDVAGSANFSDNLSTATGYPGPVTYVASGPSSPAGLEVSGSGAISTSGTLAATDYTVSGTDSDGTTYGDSGSWTYTLMVTSDTIVQEGSVSNEVSVSHSAAFTDSLSATPGFVDAVAYVVTSPSTPTGLVVSGSGAVTTSGTLGATTYAISGTDSDTYGNTGVWSYTLTVTPSSGTTTLIQTSALSGSVTNDLSAQYSAGPITVKYGVGSVTFTTTKSSTALEVSPAGLISTSGPLAIGTYSVSGTDSDTEGDSGTWTYTLTVTGVVVTVVFDANGGSGVMPNESDSQPTALSLNVFTWPGHTFVDWNTLANGSGVRYSNGSIFPFTSATTLFAQWKIGKVPSHSLTFEPNGGTGSMTPEIDNTPTAISANKYVRSGYTFVAWNSVPEGSGKVYSAGATYSFKKSIILYAQWKKLPTPRSYVVTFNANGGTGTMAAEHNHKPMSLSSNRFTRAGYTFVTWNTLANGSGDSYSNDSTYSFASSTTLYAQWKKNKKALPPPVVPDGPVIGTFARGSSTLTPALESQIQSLANQVKATKHFRVSLFGYGDDLSSIQQSDKADVSASIELGRMRAQEVATYLEGQLSSLGLKGWTISIGVASVGSGQTEIASVIATLS